MQMNMRCSFSVTSPLAHIEAHAAEAMVAFFFFVLSRKKGFMSSVRGGVEGKLGRYNVPPHPQQS